MKKSILAILLIIVMANMVFAEQKPLKIAISELEPYMGAKLENGGIFGEIVKEAFGRVGYAVEYESFPFARLVISVGDKTEVGLGIAMTEERKQQFDFSKPMYELEYGVLFKKGKINYKDINSLKAFKGGILIGTFWEKLFNENGIKFESVANQEANFQKLNLDRIDFTCGGKLGMMYFIKNKYPEMVDKLEAKIVKKDEMPVAFAKNRKNKELITEFEKGLDLIKKDGTYDKIIQKWNLK